MENLLNKKIDGQEFADQVFRFRNNLIVMCDEFLFQLSRRKIKDFEPNPKSEIFTGFLSELFCQCNNYMEDYNNPQFHISIKNGFLNFQRALNEE
jgi:hypothetical protein